MTTDFFSWTHVYMAPGFDGEDGIAYVSTFGGESAVSKSVDGGVNYAQVGLIDLYIEEIMDLAFSPEGGSQPAMMITYGYSEDDFGYNFDDYSLWLTNDIYAEHPQYFRVMCGYSDWYPYSSPLLLFLVEYAQDGSAVMIFGANDDTTHLEVWKSTDDGHSFSYWKVMPLFITDWEVLDGSTIYCATPDGFYGTSRFGPALTEDDFLDADEDPTSNRMLDIAIQPGFDPDDEDNATIIMSNVYGEVFVSLDAGDNWGLGNPVITDLDPLTNGVYLAFDSQFATSGAPGEGLIYAADSGNWGPDVEGTVQVGELDDTTVMNPGWNDVSDVGFEPLEDNAGDTATGYFSGLVVSPGTTDTGGDALYAISEMVSTGSGGGSYSAVIQAGGSVTLKGDATASAGTAPIAGTPSITPIVGVFVNGEALSVVGSALSASAATTVSGVIVVQGAISGALGQFSTGTLTAAAAAFTPAETVSVTGSDILIT
jgi:hypothetical protein